MSDSEYNRLQKLTSKSTRSRVCVASHLFLIGEETQSRLMDNCFENGDGDDVVVQLVEAMMKDERLRYAVAREYHEQFLTDGYPTRWLQIHQAKSTPCFPGF